MNEILRIAAAGDPEIARSLSGENCIVEYFPESSDINSELWGSFDAAFLLGEYTEKDVVNWTGHPHLRVCENAEQAKREIDFMLEHYEIEKKYLVEVPDLKLLEKYRPCKVGITQIYLKGQEGSHRIRKRTVKGKSIYFETLKIRINGMKCREFEKQISPAKFNSLKADSNPKKHPIVKNRYCFIYDGRYFELDIYDFWKDRATLEIELNNEREKLSLPPEIKVIKDVSRNKKYKNSYLAGMNYEDC